MFTSATTVRLGLLMAAGLLAVTTASHAAVPTPAPSPRPAAAKPTPPPKPSAANARTTPGGSTTTKGSSGAAQVTAMDPLVKSASTQFSAGQDARIDSERSRQQPSNPQGPETNGIYTSNPGSGLLGVKQVGGSAPTTNPGSGAGQIAPKPQTNEGPAYAGNFSFNAVRSPAVDATQKSSELDKSTPILLKGQSPAPAPTGGK